MSQYQVDQMAQSLLFFKIVSTILGPLLSYINFSFSDPIKSPVGIFIETAKNIQINQEKHLYLSATELSHPWTWSISRFIQMFFLVLQLNFVIFFITVIGNIYIFICAATVLKTLHWTQLTFPTSLWSRYHRLPFINKETEAWSDQVIYPSQ